MLETFIVKEEHLKLLKNMYVGWQDCETGAPGIDPKRPYGNSDVIDDIHYILNGNYIDEDELEEKGINYSEYVDKLEGEYMKLHKDMETVLQIVLHTLSFELGVYEKRGYGKEWVKTLSK